MTEKTIGVDYSELHQLDSTANRLIRKSIWGNTDDIGQQSFITPRYLDQLISRFSIGRTTHLLDVGSGAGGPAVYIADKTGCRISGIEINEVGVNVSKKLVENSGLGEKVEFHLGNAMEMPFSENTFDLAISLNVMNVFADKTELFRQVLRVLKPSGIWAFLSGTFEIDGDDKTRSKMAKGYLIPQYYDSLQNYRNKLESAGFVIEEITEYVADFRVQVKKWGDAYKKHAKAIAKEQGEKNTQYHIEYFDTYLSLVDQKRASNHLIISSKPG